MARRVWLVDATVAGVPYRWAVEDLEVETAAGEVLDYRSGLVDFPASMGDASIDVEVLDDSVDWPRVGPLVEGSRVLVRRWTVGTVLEQADVFLRGVAVDVEFGTAAEGAVWTVSEAQGDQDLGTLMPDPVAVVDDTTWEIPVDAEGAPEQWVSDSLGRSYPILFGFPGWDGVAIHPVVPVPMVALDLSDLASTYVLLSEDGDAPIDSCKLYSEGVEANATEIVSTTTDQLGRRVRVASFDGDDSIALASAGDSARYLAGFSPFGGGGVARTAYEVIAYVLRRWGPASVDWHRLRGVEDWLSGFLVDYWTEEPVEGPWPWLEDVLLPDLPVEIRTSERGRYLVPLRFRPVGRPVGSVVVGEGVVRQGRARILEPIRNEFVARFRFNRDDDALAGLVLTGSTQPGSSPASLDVAGPTRVVASGLCRASQARYGVRTGEVLDLDWCWDQPTAQAVLVWQAERDATTVQQLELLVEGGERLVAGDELELVDEELGIETLALVDGAPEEGPDGTFLTLRAVVG